MTIRKAALIGSERGQDSISVRPIERSGEMTDDEDYGASVNDWVSVVRRARIGTTAHLVALTLASYAKSDGTKIYPGVARLAVQCEISYSTARRALEKLRRAGLIEITKPGNRRTCTADEYRLILHPDLLERVDVPTPDQEHAAISKVNAQNTAAGRARAARISAQQQALKTADQRSAVSANQLVDNGSADVAISAHRRALEPAISAHRRPGLALTHERPTSIATSPEPPAEPPSSANAAAGSSVVESGPFGGSTPEHASPVGNAREDDFEAERRRQLAALEELIAAEHDHDTAHLDDAPPGEYVGPARPVDPAYLAVLATGEPPDEDQADDEEAYA